jgi:hypothetical protein
MIIFMKIIYKDRENLKCIRDFYKYSFALIQIVIENKLFRRCANVEI